MLSKDFVARTHREIPELEEARVLLLQHPCLVSVCQEVRSSLTLVEGCLGKEISMKCAVERLGRAEPC